MYTDISSSCAFISSYNIICTTHHSGIHNLQTYIDIYSVFTFIFSNNITYSPNQNMPILFFCLNIFNTSIYVLYPSNLPICKTFTTVSPSHARMHRRMTASMVIFPTLSSMTMRHPQLPRQPLQRHQSQQQKNQRLVTILVYTPPMGGGCGMSPQIKYRCVHMNHMYAVCVCVFGECYA